MQQADLRIEPDPFQRRTAIVPQHGVQEGQQRIDPVKRRTAGSTAKGKGLAAALDHRIERTEIDLGRIALVAAQRIDVVCQRGAASDVRKAGLRRLKSNSSLGGLGNTIAGALGGLGGGNLLGAIIPALASAAGGGSTVGNLAASGIGGIVVQVIAGLIKSQMNKSA